MAIAITIPINIILKSPDHRNENLEEWLSKAKNGIAINANSAVGKEIGVPLKLLRMASPPVPKKRR